MKYDRNIIKENCQEYYFKGNRVGIVLIHGFTGTPAHTKELGKFLAEKEFTVMGVRLEGHGIHHEILEKTNRYDWYYSLKRSVERMRDKVDEIFLIGFSMGGDLSILFNELDSGIKAMILINTPIYTKPKRITFWFIPLIKRFKKYKTKKWVKEMDNYFVRRDTGSYLRIPLESAWQFYKLIQETKDVVDKIDIPVYVIQSSKDEMINPQSAEFLRNKIKTLKKFDIIDTKTHALLNEYNNKEKVFEKVYNFIKENSDYI